MKYRFRTTAAAGVLAVLILATGCGKSATGQVAAVVNGDEISIQELNAELEGVNLPPNVDKQLLMRQLLQKLIDRRLLAQSAREEGLDRDPTYITQQRRLSEELLVRMYAKKAADSIRVPDATTIDNYIASHPLAFSDRKRLKVDQIQFSPPQDVEQIKQFEGDHSLADIEKRLTGMGIGFQRGNGTIDTGTLPPAMLKTILALPPGEPFIVPSNGKVIANVITSSEPIPVTQEEARQAAAQAIRTESLAKIGDTRLKEARAKAKIDYQPGYSPPANKVPAGK